MALSIPAHQRVTQAVSPQNQKTLKLCCQREVSEELGLNRNIGRLLVVDYNSEKGEKDNGIYLENQEQK